MNFISLFAQTLVTLPDPIQVAILTGFTFVVGYLFAQVGARWPWFIKTFGEYQDEVAIFLSGLVVTELQRLLSMVPPQWEGIANAFLMLIVSVLASISLFKLLGKMKVKTFRA